MAYCLWPVTSIAQTNYSSTIEKYMEAQANVKEFSGVILVANNGGIIYQKAFGYSDREWNIKNTIDSKFNEIRIISLFHFLIITFNRYKRPFRLLFS